MKRRQKKTTNVGKFLTPEEVSAMTTFKVGTLANWRSNYHKTQKGPLWVKGRLVKGRFIPCGNDVYYPKEDVDAWLNKPVRLDGSCL